MQCYVLFVRCTLIRDRYYGNAFEADIITRVHDLAQKKGATMAQVALKWVLSQKGVSAAIVGSTSPLQLDDLAGVFKVDI